MSTQLQSNCQRQRSVAILLPVGPFFGCRDRPVAALLAMTNRVGVSVHAKLPLNTGVVTMRKLRMPGGAQRLTDDFSTSGQLPILIHSNGE